MDVHCSGNLYDLPQHLRQPTGLAGKCDVLYGGACAQRFFPTARFSQLRNGAASLILGWRVKSARYWIVGSLLMIVAEGLVSMAFFWPRNTIMFIEGAAVHPAEFLRQTALEFQNLHWLRLAFNAVVNIQNKGKRW